MARRQTRGRMAGLKHAITIAGGGLAGLSLAIALRRRGVPVTVLEAGSYPRHRVCGEFISGTSIGTLEALGIAEVFQKTRRHRSIAWFERSRSLRRAELPQAAYGISRFALDESLQRLATAQGVNLVTHHRAKPQPGEGYVWTAGRRPCRGNWIGLKAHFKGIPMTADLEMHGGTNGYAGLAGVEDGWINVCGLFQIDRDLAAKGEDLLPAYLEAGGNRTLAERLRRSERRPGSFSAVAGFRLGRQETVPGLVCLGDAESMIPPFTGNGMSMAFQAAEIALDPLDAWASGGASWREISHRIGRTLHRRFRRRLAAAAMMHPFLLETTGRFLLSAASRARLLPFRTCLTLIR